MRVESKELLTRMLATENVSIRYGNCETATFNIDSRLLQMPLWAGVSEQIYLLFSVHETAHALYTPVNLEVAARRVAELLSTDWQRLGAGLSITNEFVESITKNISRIAGYVNVCEDVRAETLQCSKYPGALRILKEGYAAILDRNFFGDVSDLSKHSFIDRINLHFKCRGLLNVPFSAPELSYLQEIAQARSFTSLIEVAARVYLYAMAMAQQTPPPPPPPPPPQDSPEPPSDTTGSNLPAPEEQEGETSDEETESEPEPGQGGDGGSEDGEEQPGVGEEEEEATGTQSDAEAEASDDSSDAEIGDGQDAVTPQSNVDATTQEALEKNLSQRVDKKKVKYTTLPLVNLSEAILPYKGVLVDLERECALNKNFTAREDWFQGIVAKLDPDCRFMYQEFTRRKRAAESSVTRHSTKGEIDSSKLWMHRFADDIFLDTEIVKEGKSHGLIFVVDWSASMRSSIFTVLVQLLCLMLFARRARIPFEVYAFIQRRVGMDQSSFDGMEGIVDDSTRFVNIFSSKMNQIEFYKMGLMLLSSFTTASSDCPLDYLRLKNSTPLAEAMLIASEVAPIFQKKNRLQFVHTIFLTDGEGNSALCHDTDVLEDPKTKRTYRSTETMSVVDVLHHMPIVLKSRTKCNLIGFYVGSPTGWMVSASKKTGETLKSELDAAGFVSIPNTNYDDFFLLNTHMTMPDSITDPGERALRRQNAKVMLLRFIKLIS